MSEDRFRTTFERSPETEIDPLIPRFSLIDERTGRIICRFALDRLYVSGETVILPKIKISMP